MHDIFPGSKFVGLVNLTKLTKVKKVSYSCKFHIFSTLIHVRPCHMSTRLHNFCCDKKSMGTLEPFFTDFYLKFIQI